MCIRKKKKIDDIIIFFSGLHITYSTGVPISFEHRVHPRPRLNIAVEFTHTHTHTQTNRHTHKRVQTEFSQRELNVI